jgi:hypothetical protein
MKTDVNSCDYFCEIELLLVTTTEIMASADTTSDLVGDGARLPILLPALDIFRDKVLIEFRVSVLILLNVSLIEIPHEDSDRSSFLHSCKYFTFLFVESFNSKEH